MNYKKRMIKTMILGIAVAICSITTAVVFAAFNFTQKITDGDVIVGDIKDVSKSYLSYAADTSSYTPYTSEYYNALKLRQDTVCVVEDIKMSPTYASAGTITAFEGNKTYYTKSVDSDGIETYREAGSFQEGTQYYIATYRLQSVKTAFDSTATILTSTVSGNVITLKKDTTTVAVITTEVNSESGTITKATATDGTSSSDYRCVVGSDGLSITVINNKVTLNPTVDSSSQSVTCYASNRNKQESYIDYSKIYLNQLGLRFAFTAEVSVYVRIHIQDAWISERILGGGNIRTKYNIKDQISGVSPFHINDDNWYYDASTNIAYLKAMVVPTTDASGDFQSSTYTFNVNEGYFYHDTSANASTTYTTVEVSFTVDIVQANRARTLWGEAFDNVYSS